MMERATSNMEVCGVLIDHAEVRHLPVDEGHIVPVLCFAARILGSSAHNIARVQQCFPLGQEAACEHRAKELRKGTQVRIVAPLMGIELVMHNAEHVHIEQPSEPAAVREAVPA